MSANDPFSVPKKHALNLKARFENMAQQGEEEAKQRAEEEKKRREARDRKEREEAKKREEQRKKAEEEEYERKRQADEQKRYIRIFWRHDIQPRDLNPGTFRKVDLLMSEMILSKIAHHYKCFLVSTF